MCRRNTSLTPVMELPKASSAMPRANQCPTLCEVDPEEKLKVDEWLVMRMDKPSPPACRNVQQLKKVVMEVSIGSRDAQVQKQSR